MSLSDCTKRLGDVFVAHVWELLRSRRWRRPFTSRMGGIAVTLALVGGGSLAQEEPLIVQPFDAWSQVQVERCQNDFSAAGCVSLQELAAQEGLATETAIRGFSLGVLERTHADADLGEVADTIRVLLSDSQTVMVPWSGQNHYCVFNQGMQGQLEALRGSLSPLAADGCNSAGGLTAVYSPSGIGWGLRSPASGSGGADNSVAPSDPLDGSQEAGLWSRVSQDLLDAYFAAYTEARQEVWSAESASRTTENQAREDAQRLANGLINARIALAEYWSSPDVLEHNSFALAQQRYAGRMLFWLAFGLLVAGLVLTIVQFAIAAVNGLTVKKELPAVKAAKNATGRAAEDGLPSLTQQQIHLAETEFKFEMEKIGLTVKTSIVGVVILIFSFAFMFLYMNFVFPLSFPSVPAIEASPQAGE